MSLGAEDLSSYRHFITQAHKLANILMANVSVGISTGNLWHFGLKTRLSCAVDGRIDIRNTFRHCPVHWYLNDLQFTELCMIISIFGRRLTDG